MNPPLELSVPQRRNAMHQISHAGTERTGNTRKTRKIFCGLLALIWPFTAAFAQSSSSSQQSSSSSQQSSTPPPAQSQAQPASPEPQKPDSLAEAARKAKEKKPVAAKGKVYTEDDLSKMKGPGVSVVGDAPRKNSRPADPDGDNEPNVEEAWRARARQFLDAIAQTDEQIAQKKEEIKKFGSGGFDVTTGMKNNIAYIHDRNAQLKQLEAHRAELEQQFEELQDEGRKAGVPSSWFR
jgi:hypothetical protein